MYVCKDSAAPAHARTRAHRPAAPHQSSDNNYIIYIYIIIGVNLILISISVTCLLYISRYKYIISGQPHTVQRQRVIVLVLLCAVSGANRTETHEGRIHARWPARESGLGGREACSSSSFCLLPPQERREREDEAHGTPLPLPRLERAARRRHQQMPVPLDNLLHGGGRLPHVVHGVRHLKLAPAGGAEVHRRRH